MTQKDMEAIRQVEATLMIENMPLTPQARQDLIDIAEGRKTHEQVAREITERYKNK